MPKQTGNSFLGDSVGDLPPGNLFDVFRYIETRQEILDACELLRGRLALTNEGRIPVTVHARRLIRALWAGMKKIGGRDLPPWPESLTKDTYPVLIQKALQSREPEQFYREARHQVLAAIEEVVRWCEPAPKIPMSGLKSLKQWCTVFGIGEATLKKHFAAQRIRNEKFSDRSYRVAIEEIPVEHQAKLGSK
jgi:hypothetical protein